MPLSTPEDERAAKKANAQNDEKYQRKRADESPTRTEEHFNEVLSHTISTHEDQDEADFNQLAKKGSITPDDSQTFLVLERQILDHRLETTQVRSDAEITDFQ